MSGESRDELAGLVARAREHWNESTGKARIAPGASSLTTAEREAMAAWMAAHEDPLQIDGCGDAFVANMFLGSWRARSKRAKSADENEETPAALEPAMMQCPYCAEDIRAAAVKCRYCGSEIAEAVPRKPVVQTLVGGAPETPPMQPAVTAHAAPRGFISFLAYLIFAGLVAGVIYVVIAMNEPEIVMQRANEDMDRIERHVAAEAVEQYEIAKREGDKIQICVQAGFVAAAYLQAKDEVQYRSWKAIEKKNCRRAGIR